MRYVYVLFAPIRIGTICRERFLTHLKNDISEIHLQPIAIIHDRRNSMRKGDTFHLDTMEYYIARKSIYLFRNIDTLNLSQKAKA